MIELDQVRRSFGRGRRRVTPLAGVSTTFPDSTLTYLVGLNGTGKTTLLRCATGVLLPTAGAVRVDGVDLAATRERAGTIGFFLDPAAFHPRHTPLRHLRWVAQAKGLPRSAAEDAAAAAGLGAVAQRPIRGLSLGMRARLGVATALLGSPRTVVLDEPFNGLDVAGCLWLRHTLRTLADHGHAVVVASHNLAEVQRSADRVVVLEAGTVRAHGTVAEICRPQEALEDAFVRLVPRAAEAGPRVEMPALGKDRRP